MNQTSDRRKTSVRKPRWIALGFIGAFATSIFTVIYTGLNVEGSLAEFDSGFRPVTMAVDEVRTIDLVFESLTPYSEATLAVTLPSMVELSGESGNGEAQWPVALAVGTNSLPVSVRAKEPGRGYLSARIEADEPVGVYRVFITVMDE